MQDKRAVLKTYQRFRIKHSAKSRETKENWLFIEGTEAADRITLTKHFNIRHRISEAQLQRCTERTPLKF